MEHFKRGMLFGLGFFVALLVMSAVMFVLAVMGGF